MLGQQRGHFRHVGKLLQAAEDYAHPFRCPFGRNASGQRDYPLRDDCRLFRFVRMGQRHGQP